MTTKLYRAAEVCDLAQVQPYMLRSWEKEFPGIGVQKSAESGRLYRQSDVDQVLRIKQLVFGEGLTVAGARRKLEDTGGLPAGVSEAEVAEVLEALGADARTKIARVRSGLKSILSLLDQQAGEYRLAPPAMKAVSRGRAIPATKSVSSKSGASSKVPAGKAASVRVSGSRGATKGTASGKKAAAVRRRASA